MLYTVSNGKRHLIATASMSDKATKTFLVLDKNGNQETRYIAVVSATFDMARHRTPIRSIR